MKSDSFHSAKDGNEKNTAQNAQSDGFNLFDYIFAKDEQPSKKSCLSSKSVRFAN